MANIQEIADAWARAWEGADAEAFAALFCDEMEYRDDQAGRVSRTPGELMAFHKHFAEALSDVNLVFTRVIQDGLDACLESWRQMRDSAVASGRVFRGGYGEVFKQYLIRPVISVEHPAAGRGD